jgi:hypothetical protein
MRTVETGRNHHDVWTEMHHDLNLIQGTRRAEEGSN